MATYTWFASGGGDFNVASNWTVGGVTASTPPGPNDVAEFDDPDTGVISGNPNVNHILIDNAASQWTFTGTTSVFAFDIVEGGLTTFASGAKITASGGLGVATDPGSTGKLIIGPGASYQGTMPAQTTFYLFNIGEGDNSTGTAIIQGGSVDTEGNGASVGPSTGSIGTLAISAGGVAKFATSNPALIESIQIGRLGTGIVTVDGPGSQLLLTGAMYAGRAGTGTITLTNGAVLTETAVGTGNASQFGAGGGTPFLTGGTGTLKVLSGSTATFADSLAFGVNGATGVGLVNDATLNVGGQLRIARGTTAPGGKGTLTITDGGIVHDTAAADTSTSYVQLGAATGTTGTVSVDGQGSLLDAEANAIDAGIIGAGTLTGSNHGQIKSTGLTVGDQGSGTLNLTSGGAAITQPPAGNRAALSVGAHTGGTGSISVSGNGSTLLAVGEAVLGGTDTGTGSTAGGTGNVAVSQGGLLATENMTIESGSSLSIDGTSAALIAGNLSDGGGVTTSGLLAVTGSLSGSLTLNGGLANLGDLDSTNVTFGGAPATLRMQAFSGVTHVAGMQAGDVIDLVTQDQGNLVLKNDTITTKTGMLFLSPAPAGDTYKLIDSQDGDALVVIPASKGDQGGNTAGPDLSKLADLPNIIADLQSLVPGLPQTFTAYADDQTGGSAGAGNSAISAAMLMAHPSS
jgi:T5SS/PEP-CTERM-associated repeat protein